MKKMKEKKGFNPNMSDQDVIKTLSMENDLMLFDPNTGEEKSYKSLNELDKECYCAHLMAIKAIKENQELKKKEENNLDVLEYLEKLKAKGMTPEVLKNYEAFEDECIREGVTFKHILALKEIVKGMTCDTCRSKGMCAIFDNFNIRYCSDWEGKEG